MTARVRRWTRRRKPNDLSNRLAAIRRDRSTNLGPIKNGLLGKDRLREMVAVALLLSFLSENCLFRKQTGDADKIPDRVCLAG